MVSIPQNSIIPASALQRTEVNLNTKNSSSEQSGVIKSVNSLQPENQANSAEYCPRKIDKNREESSVVSRGNFLTPQHLTEWVINRGLDRRWLIANARSVGVEEATSLLGYKAKSPGVWLEGCNYQGQFRPDRPWRSDDNPKAKAPKYRTPSGVDHDAILVNHPDAPSYWTDLDALKQECYVVDGHPCLLITEGVAKAIAGCSQGIPTVALLGVEMGLTSKEADPQGKRYLVPSLEKLARAGLGFIIAFDADCATNLSVNLALLKLAHQLKKFGVPVYSITGHWEVEDGKGMDDFIQKNSADQFRKLLSTAITIEKWELQFQDARKLSGGDKPSKPPQSSRIVELICDKYRNKLAWNIQARAWFLYEAEQSGIWSQEPDESIEQVVSAELKALGFEYSYRHLTDIIKLMRSQLMVKKWNQTKGLIPLQNGVLDKRTRQLKEHSPGYRLTHCLPFAYDLEAKCEPILDWLRQTANGAADVVELLLAYLNAIVNQRSDLHRFLELVGSGSTGKSTYIRLAQSLVGSENVYSTNHKTLEESRFETANLYGKLLAVITESDRYTGSVNVLKAMTGQDKLNYEQKMKQGGSGFVYEGMVLIAGNETPQSSDYTSGLARRRLSVPFLNHVPPSLRRDLDSEFKSYLPGLLNVVLAMSDERVTELIRHTDKHCPSLRRHQRETLCETNPIADWIDNKVFYQPGQRLSPSELYESYKIFCIGNGQHSISAKRFSNLLLDLCRTQLGWQEVSKGRDRQGRFYEGLQLRGDDDTSTPYPITEMLGVTDELEIVTDRVTAESHTVNGCDGCDGLLESRHKVESSPPTHDDDLVKPAKNTSQCVTPPQCVTPSVTPPLDREELDTQQSENKSCVASVDTEGFTDIGQTSTQKGGEREGQPLSNVELSHSTQGDEPEIAAEVVVKEYPLTWSNDDDTAAQILDERWCRNKKERLIKVPTKKAKWVPIEKTDDNHRLLLKK